MKAKIFAIADANGTLYQGTFETTPDGAWFAKIKNDHSIPQYMHNEFFIQIKTDMLRKGDHCIECEVDIPDSGLVIIGKHSDPAEKGK